MDDQRPISELFALVVEWATLQGAERVGELSGCWEGKTSEFDVTFNGHREAIDGVPPFSARLVSREYLHFAVLGPFDGCVGSCREIDVINHFKSEISGLKAETEPA